ncbi:MAG TPA: phosphopantetheine-binding protein [Gemmataceae bacterium]|nr:phosphopantetheine-binding protein [Gemmataceae bacterium]
MTEREEILAKLGDILATEMGTPAEAVRVSEDVSIRDGLMIDSVDLVGVVMRIEEHYRIRLTHDDLARVATVGQMVDVIESKRSASAIVA